MARVPFVNRDELAASDREVFDRIAASRGSPPGHIWRALLNAPSLADKVLSIADELRHGVTLDRRYRELAVMMVGLVTQCRYEFDHHWNAARKAGVSADQLAALAEFETSNLFDERERAVLRVAKEATERGPVSDVAWNELCGLFDRRQALEIVLTVAWYNTVVRILLPLDVEMEPNFRRVD